MGHAQRIGFSRLDQAIADMGSAGLLEHIVVRVSEGEHPSRIAQQMGMPWVVLRRWLESDASRGQEMELGKRALADKWVWDGLDAVREADVDTVGLAKLRSETFAKHAGWHNRKEYGAKTEVEITGTATINIVEVLARARGRLVTEDPVTVEQIDTVGTQTYIPAELNNVSEGGYADAEI